MRKNLIILLNKCKWKNVRCNKNGCTKNHHNLLHDGRASKATEVKSTDTKPYDLNPLDWSKAARDIEIGDCQKDNTFWCSALVSYIYIKLGFLPEKLNQMQLYRLKRIIKQLVSTYFLT